MIKLKNLINRIIGSKYRYGVKTCDMWLKSATLMGRVMQYGIKTITVRHKGCGPMAVFDTLQHAQNFFDTTHFTRYRYFKCRYRKSNGKKMYNFHDISSFVLPNGTSLADTVELIKEL